MPCRIFVVSGLLALVSGCLPSLHPLYTDKDLIFMPGLVGQWAEEDSKETWHFEKAGDNKYELTHTNGNGRKGEFEVHLLKVDGYMFLDLFPKTSERKENEFYTGHFLPTHTFLHVRQIEPTLQMRFLDAQWFEKRVLTDRPKAMQEFFIKHFLGAFW